MANDSRRGHILLAVILLGLFLLKLNLNQQVDDVGIDGAYYLDLAKHVAAGHGLVTDASLYHEGLPSFPYPSPVQPFWPRLLGMVAWVFPMKVVQVWLPTLLYFTSLLAAYRLGKEVYPDVNLGSFHSALNGGHLGVLLLGFNTEFFLHTTRPYTEGLAFTLLLLWMSRVRLCFTAPSLMRGLESGVWLGLLLLVRSQFIVAIAAFACALGLRFILIPSHRKETVLAAIGACIAFALTILPQLLFLRSFIEGAGLDEMIRFERFQARDALPKLELLVQTDGLWAWIKDRSKGFLVAFPEGQKYSYYQQFGAFYWSLPAAILLGIPVAWQNWRAGKRPWTYLRSEQAAFHIFLALSAIAWFCSIHVLHKANFTPWNFAIRHAIPCLFLFIWANMFLLRQGGLSQLAGLFFIFSGLHYQFQTCLGATHDVQQSSEEKAIQSRILDFLREQKAANPDLRIASPIAQNLASLTDGIGYDGVYHNTTLNDLEVMFRQFGDDFFIIKADDTTRLMRDTRFTSVCQPWPTPVEAWNIYTCFAPEVLNASPVDPSRP